MPRGALPSSSMNAMTSLTTRACVLSVQQLHRHLRALALTWQQALQGHMAVGDAAEHGGQPWVGRTAQVGAQVGLHGRGVGAQVLKVLLRC